MAENMAIKRLSNAVVDAITAEDIGKFPDKNVAESLSRITGVGVSREFGEGEKITVRGASSATNRTLLNGQTVATADWFILDNPGRSFNYTMLPSALVRDLEVRLGYSLCKRGKSGFQMTEEGEETYAAAQELFSNIGHFRQRTDHEHVGRPVPDQRIPRIGRDLARGGVRAR